VASAVRWAHRSDTFSALSCRFAVRSDDARLGHHVDALLAGLVVPGGAPEHWYSLTLGPDGGVDVRCDEETLASGQRPGDAIGWLVWDVNRRAAEAGDSHLLFHAAAVAAGEAGVVLPGPSGSGKSTLATGLAAAGLGYLSDELVALDLASGRLVPYPKPATVKPGSYAAVRALGLGPRDDGDADLWEGEEWHLAVGGAGGLAVAGGPVEPAFVLVPRFEAGAQTRLEPLPDTAAFLALALHGVNYRDRGAPGSQALGDLVTRCECYDVIMSDLGEACRLVLELVGREAPGAH
jgi:hypothetical protein